MSFGSSFDRSPNDADWGHYYAPGAGVRLHYVRQGKGPPVLLLHGWPGFWYDWRHVIPLLAGEADLIAPDFRGFGGSDKPDLPPAAGYSPAVLAADLLALLDHLQLERVVVAAHDIGASVAQVLARTAPQRISALVLFDPAYGGVGNRRYDPGVQQEFWYQHLHNLSWADQLIGYNRDTVALYLGHFYDHWVGRKDSVRPIEFGHIVDQYAQPGAVRASIAYYKARAGSRQAEANAAPPAPISQPTIIRWGEADPVMRVEWADRLGEYFADYQLRTLPGVGHFVPFEAADEAAAAIRLALQLG